MPGVLDNDGEPRQESARDVAAVTAKGRVSSV